ncbi:MAG TPA: branched-chain amino acid ABC transporter substrate-binding protein [Candidatus Baltobacteraceae bacterium]
MRRAQFLSTSAAAAAAAAALPARAQFAGQPLYAQQVTICVTATLSGARQAYGLQLVSGVRAAVDEANRLAPPLARVFGVRTLDDQDAIAVSITDAQVATADPSVIAVVGNLSNDVTRGTLSQYANLGLPLIVPTSSGDDITSQGYRNLLRLPTKDTTQGQLFARTVLPIVKPAYALAVTQASDYGPDIAQGFVAQGRNDRHKADSFSFSVQNPDYSAAAKAIVGIGPDYIFLAGQIAAMGPLIPALLAAGYKGTFGASDGFYSVTTPTQYATQLGGAWISAALPPLQRVPTDFQILNDFTRGYGPVTVFSAYGYAAAQIVISTVNRANSNDRNVFLQTMQSGAPYDTLLGPFTFDFSGDPLQPNLYFYTIDGAGFKYQRAAFPANFIL